MDHPLSFWAVLWKCFYAVLFWHRNNTNHTPNGSYCLCVLVYIFKLKTRRRKKIFHYPLIVQCREVFLSDFMFKWLWLTNLILSVKTLRPLGNMCFIMQRSKALGSVQHNQSFKAFVLIISCNQQQSSEMTKRKSFVLIPAHLRCVQCELCFTVYACVCVCMVLSAVLLCLCLSLQYM